MAIAGFEPAKPNTHMNKAQNNKKIAKDLRVFVWPCGAVIITTPLEFINFYFQDSSITYYLPLLLQHKISYARK